MWCKAKKYRIKPDTQNKQHKQVLGENICHDKTLATLFIVVLLNSLVLPVYAVPDTDGLAAPSPETCDGNFSSGAGVSGTCDASELCDDQRECLSTGMTPDGLRSCNFNAVRKCQHEEDFDCDNIFDNAEFGPPAVSNPTISGILNPDYDSDLLVRNCDDDDDNDGILDGPDDCEEGDLGWLSNAGTDYDSDGCRDAGVEDNDDDNDGVLDTAPDNCPIGELGWVSTGANDYDGDGCRDGFAEETDDDNDGIPNVDDGCPTGNLGWTSDALTDNDSDGCRDAGEDLDDDNDLVLDLFPDNCLLIPNPDQANNGGDAALGDACDPDMDGDSILNTADACPLSPVINAGLTINGYDSACDHICWRPHAGLPGSPVPPTIDGVIDGSTTVTFGGVTSTHDTDIGWNGAHRAIIDNGTSVPHVAFQALRNNSADLFYMSFQVKNDPGGESAGDTIVITFRPNFNTAGVSFPAGNALNDVRIIYNVQSNNITLATYSGTSWNDIALPAGMLVVKNPSPASDTWDVEMAVPTTGWATFANDFKFYFNVIRENGSATEFVWPDYGHLIGGNIASYDYNNQEWGIGTTDTTACSGVYLETTDITTSNVPDNSINLLSANTFNAFVRNDSAVTANNINASFRIADWGIADKVSNNAVWRKIPGTPSNPTAAQNVPVAGAMFSMDWTVPVAERPLYDETDADDMVGYQHQCIYVELDSTSNANITNRSARRNMNFDEAASVFERKAKIDARGLPKPLNGKTEHTFILQESRQVLKPVRIKDIEQDNKKHDLAAKRLTRMNAVKGAGKEGKSSYDKDQWISQTQWLVHGYRETGNYVEIKGVKYPLTEPVASFGYVISHTGELVEKWLYDISGAGVEKISEGQYRINIPQDGFKEIVTRLESIEVQSFLDKLIGFIVSYWWLFLILLFGFLYLLYKRMNP